MFRNLAAAHPVSALLLRTNHIEFALEKRATAGLFNASTLLDVTFGWGAAGCLEFVGHQLASASITFDFEADIASRGLQHLPVHKYAKLYSDVFARSVGKLLDIFYASDKAVAADVELQNWAMSCAAVMQLRGFPATFTSKRADESAGAPHLPGRGAPPRNERRQHVGDHERALQ